MGMFVPPSAMKLFTRSVALVQAVLSVSILLPAVVSTPSYGQAAPPAGQARDQADFEKAAGLADQGKFEEAAKLYEGIPNNYPTSPLIPQAALRLGYVYFRMSNWDQAVKMLQKVPSLKGASPEVIELAASLVPQVISARASTYKPGEPRRKATFEDALRQFDAFLQKFPNSREAESANYGKAVAAYQVEKYDDALNSLRTNLQKFPQSPSVLDSQYLMALTMATVANVASVKNNETADAAAQKNYENAEKMLEDLINKRTDIPLGNESRFQIAEMLSSRAQFTKDPAAQKALFARALDSYRLVGTKEEVVEAQKARIEAIRAARTPAVQAADPSQFAQLGRTMEKESEKLATIEGRPDQALTAKIKMGEVYFHLARYDESRTLLKYLTPIVTDEDQKKEVAYYLAMSYASQNAATKGANKELGKTTEAAYEAFKKQYPTDQIGENLGLVVGAGFITSQPEKAIKYSQDFLGSYPKSKLRNAALAQQAAAYAQMENFDEAIKMYDSTLAGNPPKDVAAAAEFSKAVILQKQKKIPEALAAFKNVREKYAGLEQAEEAGYYLGQLTLENGDAKGGLAELQKFIRDHPKSALMGKALFYLGQAQAETGKTKEALETYKQIPEKYPEDEVAPFSYFARAKIMIDAKQNDEVIAMMRDFIKKFPENPQLYQAYDFIAQIQTNQQDQDGAVATYESYAKDRPTDLSAPLALLKAATLWKDTATKIGKYMALNDDQKGTWTKDLDKSQETAERLLRGYPESQQVALALNLLLDVFKLRQSAKLITDADIEKYFQSLADEFRNKPATRSKITFTVAGYLAERDRSKATALMEKVYDKTQKYAPEDLDLYIESLISQKKLPEARAAAEKLGQDYPVPKGVDPNKASAHIQEAQSISLFWVATVAQAEGKTEEAKAKFDELEKLYSWSPKMVQANYGISKALYDQKKYDEALTRLTPVIRNAKAPADLRAKAMLLLAEVHEAKGNPDDAINNYIKISTFYGGVPDTAAEGLWRGAQLLDKQSSGAIPIPTPTPKPVAAPKPAAAVAPKK